MVRAATSPAPTRRTPTRERKSPARLGLNDSWGPGASSKWVSVDNDTKEKLETEKVAKREKAVAQQNKVDAKKKATFTVDSTGLKSKKYPMAAACLQGGILAGLGEATVSMIKGTPQDGERVATCAVFGFLVAQLLVRYLAFVNKTKLVKKNKMLDSFAKVVVDQLSMAPVLTVLSLVYFKLAQARPAAAHTHAHTWARGAAHVEPHRVPGPQVLPADSCGVAQDGMGADVVEHVQDNFMTRYEQAAAFSACMAFANFYLVTLASSHQIQSPPPTPESLVLPPSPTRNF